MRRTTGRKRHSVRAHRAKRKKYQGWHVAPKRKSWRVKRHMSNPFGGQAGAALTQGLIAAGFILGGLFVVGMANRQMDRFPMLSSGYANLAGKLALALGGSMGALWAVRKGYISQGNGVALAGVAFVPLAVGGLNRFAPNIAGQISLSGVGEHGMDAELQDDGVSGVVQYGDINADMDAELTAELQADMDSEDSAGY